MIQLLSGIDRRLNLSTQDEHNMGTTRKASSSHWRAVAIGLVLIPANCYWITHIELVQYSAQPTIVSLIFTVVFSVFFLSLLNLLLKQFFPQKALSQAELLLIYSMLSVTSAIGGHSFMEILVPILGHAFWFATPENDWKSLFWRYIPEWLSVNDKKILSGYYKGNSTLYTKQHLLGWITPVSSWFAFILVLLLVMVCINIIFRKQWTEEEKLTYPIIQLPYQMTSENFFKIRTLWIAFGITAGLDIVNGLHILFPSIPALFEKVYRFRFPVKPWSTMGTFTLGIYPFVAGIGFLIPLDLLFSCWFFWGLWKVQLLFGSVMGWKTSAGVNNPVYPYVNYQGFGAYIGLFLIILFQNRKHLGRILKTLIIDDRNSVGQVSYRTPVLVLVGGLIFLVIFCLKTGMSWWVSLIFFLLYFSLSTAISRMRAELGAPMHDLHYTGPEQIMVTAVGTRKLGPMNLSMFSFFWFFTRTFDSHPMPHQLEGFKLAERSGVQSKFFFTAILIAMAIGVISQFWALLSVSYTLGAVNQMSRVPMIYGQEPWEHLQRWLVNPVRPNYIAMGFSAFGIFFAIFLMLMRIKFLWWPLHPAAYAAASGSWAINYIWFSLFSAWIVKLLLLRFGGLQMYRKATPFFLGLILGQFVVGSIWPILGIIFRVPTYGIWP